MKKFIFCSKNKDDSKLESSIRKIDREKIAVEQKLEKLRTEINKLVAKGDMTSARVIATQYVRTQQAMKQITKQSSNLETVGTKVKVARINHTVGDGITMATTAISRMKNVATSSAVGELAGNFKTQIDV